MKIQYIIILKFDLKSVFIWNDDIFYVIIEQKDKNNNWIFILSVVDSFINNKENILFVI